jgi:hypothetical protein
MGPSTSFKSYNEPHRLIVDDLKEAGGAHDDMDAEVASRSAVTPFVKGD